jgi:signal peptidase I
MSVPHIATSRQAKPHLMHRLMALLITATAMIGIWLVAAPVALGGPTSYVVTDGVSMLPHLHANGLVLTHTASSYQVGDIVAYHNRELGVVVLHRIVARDGDRYVFKGDNNDFRDSYRPTKADLVGKEWVYWPGGGRYLALLHTPAFFGILLAALGLYAGSAFVPAKNEEEQIDAG